MREDFLVQKALLPLCLSATLVIASGLFTGHAHATGPDPLSQGSPLSHDTGEPLPSLEVILELTSTRAPEVELGEAAVQSSRSSAVGARRPPVGNPVLTVFGEHGDAVTKGPYIESQLDLPVEIWGQRRKRIAESNALVELAKAGADVARASALAEAVHAYGVVVASLERLHVIGEAITAAQTEADVYRARLELKDATLRDAHLATMEVARNEVLRVEARAALRSALAQLERLTGRKFAAQHAGGSFPEPPRGLALGASPADPESAPIVRETEAEADYHQRVGERAASEGRMPLSLILRAVRGDLGDARVGGGVALGFPVFQRNQGERARALAESERARRASSIQQRSLETALEGLRGELEELIHARKILETVALPAARDAVSAAQDIQKAGKGELLPILISRRDYAALRLRRLEILEREWRVLSDVVRITGATP